MFDENGNYIGEENINYEKITKKPKRKAGKIVLFLWIVICMISFWQKVLIPKWESDGLWEPVTTMIDGFFAEDTNTIDVIYLGSSNAFYDINPLVIYEDYGITGYVLGSGEQPIAVSYYYLQEALKHQKPKAVVLDCLSVYATEGPGEEQNRKAYDYMPLSVEKIASLRENIGEEENVASYVFPISRYHGRIWDLTVRDFTYLFSDRAYALKGYAFSNKQVENLPELNMEVVLHTNIEINEKNQTYLRKIQDLCKENEIQLLFIKTPNIEWGRHEHEKMLAQAEKMGIPFVDYNSFYKDLGITVEECFLDGAHLNYKGAEKLSKHLGETVIGMIQDVPKHSRKVYKQWEADLTEYKNLIRIK